MTESLARIANALELIQSTLVWLTGIMAGGLSYTIASDAFRARRR